MKSQTLLLLVLVGLCAISANAQGHQPGGFVDYIIDKFRDWRTRFINWIDPRNNPANQQQLGGGFSPGQQPPMPMQQQG